MTSQHPHRDRLAAETGVTVFGRTLPHDPAEVGFVMAGVRCYDLRRDGARIAARFHIGQNEWLGLGTADTEDAAYARILAHHQRIGHLPAWYTPATDAAERQAADEVAAEHWLGAALPF